MSKHLLTERFNTILEYTETSTTNPNCLGHLAGIGAEFNKATRNGRRYPIELWRNVMESEDFKEGMETHTLFSESDHPSDRIDTSIKEVCAVLTNMEIREDEGILWVEFDILDTPQGRILKSLIDYGCKIGVSSRGLGDEIQKNGETIIDPDTYSYYGHDMVVQPAVKAARPDKVESVARAKVTDVFKKEIENATTRSELIGLKRLAESVNIPNLDSISESIENKLSNSSIDGNNISEQLENDLGKLAEENEDLRNQLESLKKSNNISVKKNRKITETYQTEAITARRTLRRMEVKNERLERVNRELTDELNEEKVQLRMAKRSQSKEIESLQKRLDDALSRIDSLENELKESRNENRSISKQNDSLKETCDLYKNRMRELESEISDKSDELDSLYEENSALNDDLETARSKSSLTESKVTEASTVLVEKDRVISETLEKYIDAKCLSEGIDRNRVKANLPSKYTIEDIDAQVSKLADEKSRLNKLPISLGGSITATIENINSSSSSEMSQTMRLLEGVKNHL